MDSHVIRLELCGGINELLIIRPVVIRSSSLILSHSSPGLRLARETMVVRTPVHATFRRNTWMAT